ncbi:Acg family FMN-binding oxidoreductase [Nocardia sp. NPDC056064]|uniref:Acg family FMN-binding oxidoreductase n=1 Tax=Nocardia sp. NPDC056064 TaxID=3345701 RepID=UPI0035D58E25
MTIEQHPGPATVRAVFERAARAPSLHNSQPWRWRWDGSTAELLVNAERLLPATDMFNREGVLACGVMLHHADLAWAAAGWESRVSRFPDPSVRAHVASLEPRNPHPPGEAELLLGRAVDARYSDRMPMEPPPEWTTTPRVLEFLGDRSQTKVVALDAAGVGELGRISQLTGRLRRYDPRYGTEMAWWTAGPEHGDAGVPADARPSAADRAQVPVGREFPAGTAAPAEAGGADAARVVVLCTDGDAAADLLDCGYALSAILIECTTQGLSTCTVSHITELPAARTMLAELVGLPHPQVLVRIGTARTPPPPRTPRLPLDRILAGETGQGSGRAGGGEAG